MAESTALAAGMRWSGFSVVGRELSRTVFTIVLARLVGPDDFGVVAQALVYVGIISLLLDQGFSSALIQRKDVHPDMPGVVVSVNLAVGCALAALTVAIAPLWAEFMRTPELAVILVAFAPSLLLRAAAVTPRAMLIRGMDFRKMGIADIASAMLGGIAGVIVAVSGGGYWSLVVQILATDVVLLSALCLFGASWRPNANFGQLRHIAAFSGRAFMAGLLLNSLSRNVDNLLIGRVQGAQALAFYGLAYRLLLLPVQLALQTVATVLYPLFSRLADDIPALRDQLTRTTRLVAMGALPTMALIAAAAPQLVAIVFGPQWAPAVPIVQVLAVAGALQAIYQCSTSPLCLGTGHDKLHLRYAWLTTAVATLGIVAGLPFGPFGVALGYSVATALLVPVEWLIRRHLVDVSLHEQLSSLLPATHVAVWMAGTYLTVAVLITDRDAVVLGLGSLAAVGVGALALRIGHPRLLADLVFDAKRLAGRDGSAGVTGEPR
ncbi:lipopolysaccharide biosynthesis protein [Mycolicibacterium lacusdiani]|uniref:lipopolysaccharide biosynthesis protein n=1 Tax=Mycolicibacterium lacusdiani TaxID=2895283 RepID=UPI001F2AE2E1|nr:lipopolysaccharide biosynthesis protein [Mycolicibacterium lacusdiani]